MILVKRASYELLYLAKARVVTLNFPKETRDLAIESIVVLNSTEVRLGYLKHLYEKIIEKTSLVIIGT
jgi:hypothetical protein